MNRKCWRQRDALFPSGRAAQFAYGRDVGRGGGPLCTLGGRVQWDGVFHYVSREGARNSLPWPLPARQGPAEPISQIDLTDFTVPFNIFNSLLIGPLAEFAI